MSGFDLPEARRWLRDVPGLFALHVLESASSTNDEARRLAAAGAPEGTVVVADRQTAGRGRHGRPWHSPPGCGLYVSTLFRPVGEAADATRFTLASAVAACQAAREMGAEVEIKWPNDLLWRGRKVAGTLAELRTTGTRIGDLVVGTGFNVDQEAGDFPPELSGSAASLRMAAGAPVDRQRLLALYLRQLLGRAEQLRSGGWAEVRAAWAEMAPGATGGRVRVLPGRTAPPFDGITAGIDAAGALRVRDAQGGVHALTLTERVVPFPALEA